MKLIKRIFVILIVFSSLQNNLLAQAPYFVDFKYVLNESKAGKEAQNYLKKKLDNGIKN